MVDELFLRDLTIAECDGCHTCWAGKGCSKNDDMCDVYPKVAASDVIVFGTPVYWYGPTGLMKTFIDRFVYFNCPANREEIVGKSAVIAVPFEEDDPETARLVAEFFEKSLAYLQVKLLDRIMVPGVGAKGEILERTDCLAGAYELGRRLVRDGRPA